MMPYIQCIYHSRHVSNKGTTDKMRTLKRPKLNDFQFRKRNINKLRHKWSQKGIMILIYFYVTNAYVCSLGKGPREHTRL